MRKVKEKSLFTEPLAIKEYIAKLIELISEGLFEKQHIMSVALLSAIAGESIFLLGPPGTAKSMVARRLKLVFKEAKSFEYLMSRFSTPDEIFGPVSISKLKNEDKYERLVSCYLPDADVVFLDEIWKAGPAIQNALLTTINERIFKNGSETLKLPMKVLIAASNELPAEDEGLEALWDRFLVRIISNCISNEKTFYKMVRSKNIEDPIIQSEYLIKNEQLKKWSLAIDCVDIPDEICRIVTHIRKFLIEEQKKEEISPLDYYVSDRRWKKIIHLMQTSAYLNGRKAIDITDCILLFHCLWNKVTAIPVILNAVCTSITSDIDNQIEENTKAIDKMVAQLSANMPKGRISVIDEDEYVVKNHFYYIVEEYSKENCLFAKFDYNHIDANKAIDGILYYEDKNQHWIIHAIYTRAPFDYRMNNGKINKVKLQKCRGGILVDGVPYLFKKQNRWRETAEPAIPSFSKADVIFSECQTIKSDFERLKGVFEKNNNLFVSSDDIKLINRQLLKTETNLKKLDVKIQNTRLLIR